MPVAIRTITRLQDADDAPALGAGQTGYALTWNNATGAFVATALFSGGLLATGVTVGATSQAQNFTVGVTVGTVASAATLLQVAETSTASPRGIMSSQHNTGTDGARFHMRKSRGTNAAPTVIATGDVLGRLVASGYDGSNYLEMGGIDIVSAGTIASTRVPTEIRFLTATDAAPSVLTQRMVIDKAGNVGIGTIAPVGTLEAVTQIGTEYPLWLTAYASDPVPGIVGRSARGTQATPAATQLNDFLFAFGGRGHTGSAFETNSQALIAMKAAEIHSGTNQGTYITFGTTPIGSVSRAEVARITDTGRIGIGTTSPATALHVVGAATITAGIRPAADSTTALQLQNAAGTAQVTIDTTSGNIQLVGNTVYSSHATSVTFGRSNSGPRIWFAYNDALIYGNNLIWREAVGFIDLARFAAMGALTITTPIRSAFAFGSSSWWLTGDTELTAIGVKTHVRAGADSNILYGLYLNPNYDANGKASVRKFGIYTVGELDNYFSGNLGIKDTAPAEALDVTGNANVTGVYKVDDVQVLSNRVIDARCADVANSGDATTDGLIDALRDAMVAHGLIAAA